MLFYFTGTGNSRWVAEQLAASLGDAAVNMMEAGDKAQAAFRKGERVGLVFPVYAWDAPALVHEFARTVRMEGAFAFAVCTYGSEAGYAMRKLAKDFPFVAGYGVTMPSNFVIGNSAPKASAGSAIRARGWRWRHCSCCRGGREACHCATVSWGCSTTRHTLGMT